MSIWMFISFSSTRRMFISFSDTKRTCKCRGRFRLQIQFQAFSANLMLVQATLSCREWCVLRKCNLWFQNLSFFAQAWNAWVVWGDVCTNSSLQHGANRTNMLIIELINFRKTFFGSFLYFRCNQYGWIFYSVSTISAIYAAKGRKWFI